MHDYALAVYRAVEQVLAVRLHHAMRLHTFIAFVFAFCAVFYVVTFSNPHYEVATAWHRFDVYGWPQAWLHLHTMDTTQWINGQKIEGRHSIEGVNVDWLPCIVSLLASAAIAAVLVSPIIIFDLKRRKGYAA